MKKQLLFISLFGCSFAFSQNLSQGFLNTITLPSAGQEVFRFAPGFASQIISGSNTSFGISDKWFSHGQFNVLGGQSFYGSRFQNNGKALVMGFSGTSSAAIPGNPRIEWIGATAASAGNLEFRSGIGFGVPGTPGTTTLVASMTPQGNTYFGTANPALFASNNPLVGIGFNGQTGMQIRSNGTVPSNFNPNGLVIDLSHSGSQGSGLFVNSVGTQMSYGVFSRSASQQTAIGVYGATPSNAAFTASIYGDAQVSGGQGSNLYAGYFNGDIATTAGFFQSSDAKLKENVNREENILKRISMLRPVNYSFKNVEGIALANGQQHGFISQEMAEVFPELTKDILHPVFDKEGKVVSELSYKAINYIGLISVLTAGIQELNTELAAVREELADYKANDNLRSQLMQNSKATNGYFLEQNIPNPFDDRSIIRYQLAPGVERATISIFNLNGGLVTDYALSGNKGEITILASDIGKGMFIYSLNLNGQEILSKRMIVK